jgi:hypothetical protein
VNLRMVQEDLGHARLETTRRYLKVEDAERKAAAAQLTAVDGASEDPQQLGTDVLAQVLAAALLAGDGETEQ